MLIKAFGRKRGAFQFPISTPIFTKNFRCLFFSIFRSHSPPIAQNSKCNSNRPNFRFPPFPCMPTHAPKIVKPSSRLSSAKPHQKRPPRARKSIITTTTPVVVPVKLARVRKLPLSLMLACSACETSFTIGVGAVQHAQRGRRRMHRRRATASEFVALCLTLSER